MIMPTECKEKRKTFEFVQQKTRLNYDIDRIKSKDKVIE